MFTSERMVADTAAAQHGQFQRVQQLVLAQEAQTLRIQVLACEWGFSHDAYTFDWTYFEDKCCKRQAASPLANCFEIGVGYTVVALAWLLHDSNQ